jgi:hypothetical protein
MEKNLFFVIAFFYTGFVFSQDSSDRKALGKQTTINKASNSNYSEKSTLNESTRGFVSMNSTDTIPHQTTGDYKEKKRIIISENSNMDEPK